jgi:DNA-directed RNA polymerase subunit E'/Rpb7
MSGLTLKKTKSKRTKSVMRVDNMLFSKSIITRQVDLPIVNVGKNIMQTFSSVIKNKYEGRCSIEGYIKSGSVNIISYSAGKQSGDNVSFTVVFDCEVCTPVEGMFINCIASNITKAGIRAHAKETPSPVVIFIARDHYYDSDKFNSIKEGDTILAKVIGSRYELYDSQISVIAEISNKM